MEKGGSPYKQKFDYHEHSYYSAHTPKNGVSPEVDGVVWHPLEVRERRLCPAADLRSQDILNRNK